MHTITKKLLKFPELGIIKQEIDQYLKDERVKRNEFYNKITEKDKAEFINGEIIMHSPVKGRHNYACANLVTLLKNHITLYSLGFLGFEHLMTEFTRNSYEPDICFFGPEKATKFHGDQVIFPVPDFIVEVLSKKTEHRDRKVKYNDYASHGVREYWIISPKMKTVEQYICENGQYKLLGTFSGKDKITCDVIAGFEIEALIIFDEEAFREYIVKDKVQIVHLNKEIVQTKKIIEDKEKIIEDKDKLIEDKDKTIKMLEIELAKLKK